MGKTVIIGDVKTLDQILSADVLSTIGIHTHDFKVLDWLQLSSDQKSACIRYGVKYVSLTEYEVEETIRMFQQDCTHSVGLTQYGALVFAKNNDALFASCDQLTLEMGKRIGLIRFRITESQSSLLPMFEVYGIDNQITVAI